MMLIKLLLNIEYCLIFIGATAFVIKKTQNDYDGAFNYRLPDFIIPQHYDIVFMPYINRDNTIVFNSYGEVAVKITILKPTNTISLHAQKPYIKVFHSILINDDIDTNTNYYVEMYKYDDKTDILTLHVTPHILPGNYSLMMHFNGISYNDASDSFRIAINMNEKTTYSIGTDFQAVKARRAFPCWDEPAIRTTFNISINCHKNYTVISNTMAETIFVQGDMKWSVFRTTPAIPTYLVAISLMNANYNNHIKYKIGHWYYRRDLEPYVHIAKEITDIIINNLTNGYRNMQEIPKMLDIVVIPGFQDNSISNWELIFYREEDIYKQELDHSMKKINMARLISREIIHHYFGNYVSPSWWSHFWLNDGIAMLLGIHVIEKVLPSYRISDLFVVQILHESLHLDRDNLMNPLISSVNNSSEINSHVYFFRYSKAPAILRMLRYVVTDEVFWNATKLYSKRHRFGSATSDDFWNDMQSIIDTVAFTQNYSIKSIMDTWTKRDSYPVLKVEQNYNNSDIIMLIENFHTFKPNDDWWIPVTIATQSRPRFNQYFDTYGKWIRTTEWHDPYYMSNLTVQLEDWIIVNPQQTGYYRVNYDTTNWIRIADFLQMNHTMIHVLNRAQIIDDAFHLMEAGQLSANIFWELTSYLWKETDYIAWYPMFKALEYMSSFFPLHRNEVVKIKIKISHLLYTLLLNIGYDSNIHNDENHNVTMDDEFLQYLKQEAARWACILNVTHCLDAAQSKLKQHLEDSETNKLLPWWKEWTYCNGIVTAKSLLWSKVFRKLNLETEPDYAVLKALTCCQNSHLIEIYLQTVESEYNLIKYIKSQIYGFFYNIARNAKRSEIFDYLLKEGIEKMKPVNVTIVVAVSYIINHVYTKEQLYKISNVINNTDRHLAFAIQDKIDKRWNQVEHQITYFTNFFK
ncbi:hypothetical protein P5V15_013655 [Pogonomyrmex californicus]